MQLTGSSGSQRRVASWALGALVIASVPAPPLTVASSFSRQTFGPGRCGPVDNAYTELAKATGGQVFVMSPSDAPAPSLFGTVATAGDKPLVLALEPTAPGVASPVSFAVDRSIRRLIINAAFDGKGGTLDLLSPDNVAVEASDRVTDARLACSRMLTVDHPRPGMWRGNVVPTERFWLRVFAESDVEVDPQLVERRGRSPKEIPQNSAGEPVAGRPAMLRVLVLGPIMKSYEFALTSDDGQLRKNVALAQSEYASFEGTIDVPSKPFRVTVSGVDDAGMRYQRSSRVPFHPRQAE